MTERLEELIDELPYSIRYEPNTERLIKLAIEQAERVEELEKDRDALEIKIDKAYRDTHNYKQALEDTKEFLERMEKGQSLGRSHYVGYNLIEALNTINKALEREGNG